jgi:hypothetical protein
MARLTQGALGAINGKLGGMVGATWKGIPYLRSLPGRRSKKRTAKEASNQSKFALIHRWLQPLLVFLREGFKGYSPTVEGFNAAKSYNLRNAFVIVDDKYVVDPSLVLVSHGDLPLADNISCELTENELHFSWDTNLPYGANDYDQVMLLAYRPEQTMDCFKTTGEFRKTGKDMLKLHKAGEYHVYLAFVASDRSRQSNSVYLGKVSLES